MNVDRIRLQQAVAVGRGVALALKHGELPPGYADALASDEAEAEDIAFAINADRKWDEAVGRMGR